VGLDQEEARKRLEGAGLKVGKVSSRDNRGKPGQVLQQRPAAGVFIPRMSRIDLVIGK
jgi:beta-lactam-binding protein with PASTA domain